MHPLIELNRAYCAGEITLDEILQDLRSSAPELFVEAEDRPLPKYEPSQKVAQETIDIAFDEIPATATPQEAAHAQGQEIMEKTRWMTDQNTHSTYPYDDFGNVPPLN
jgi:hypothetical protein